VIFFIAPLSGFGERQFLAPESTLEILVWLKKIVPFVYLRLKSVPVFEWAARILSDFFFMRKNSKP